MITVHEAQANVRRTGQIWCRGLYDSNVCISVTVLGQVFAATAEVEYLSREQFTNALARVYPDYEITVEQQGWPRADGYWRATGHPKEEA